MFWASLSFWFSRAKARNRSSKSARSYALKALRPATVGNVTACPVFAPGITCKSNSWRTSIRFAQICRTRICFSSRAFCSFLGSGGEPADAGPEADGEETPDAALVAALSTSTDSGPSESAAAVLDSFFSRAMFAANSASVCAGVGALCAALTNSSSSASARVSASELRMRCSTNSWVFRATSPASSSLVTRSSFGFWIFNASTAFVTSLSVTTLNCSLVRAWATRAIFRTVFGSVASPATWKSSSRFLKLASYLASVSRRSLPAAATF